MLLVGVGIMSVILVVLFKEFDFNLKMEVVEFQEFGVIESFNLWNNVGIGYVGLCELNYILQLVDGSIDIKKVVGINIMFEVLKQFWLYLVVKGIFGLLKIFINLVLYLSFVCGSEGIVYLKKCFELLIKYYVFEIMVYFEDKVIFVEWMLLMMLGCLVDEVIVVICVEGGIDVNFGVLINQFL